MLVFQFAFVLTSLLANLAHAGPISTKYGKPVCQQAVNEIIDSLSIADMQADLNALTSFYTRYYNSSSGAAVSKWLLSYVTAIASRRDDVSAKPFVHSEFPQTSTIVRFEGHRDPNGPVTILGSHIDSVTAGLDPSVLRSYGADDDGTGSTNVLATFKALILAGFKPSTPLEFHWYAGEEGGLLGSSAISKQYKADGVKVKAYMQLDMNAYTRPGDKETIAVRQDFSEPELNTFLESLIETYIGLPIVRPKCGYPCSDHASWHAQGYPASMPFEGAIRNPVLHTVNDTVDAPGFSWEHSKQFAKLAVAYAYELTV